MVTVTKPLNRERNPPRSAALSRCPPLCCTDLELAEAVPSVKKRFLKIKMEIFFKRAESSNRTQSITAFSNCLLLSVFKYLHIYPVIFSFQSCFLLEKKA